MDVVEKYRRRVAYHAKRHRESIGLSQSAVAERMETTNSRVSAIENARVSVGLDTLAKLAIALGVDAYELLLPMSEAGLTADGGQPSEPTRPARQA
ncbi:helix-turn-helix domain-containing protein [Solirhodobacter olei]|uniref:helix-turn-helix domain-containing protein n=1 Tax=Solirhodobacter olei TaxID=2493082 RepID=UPI000FD76121